MASSSASALEFMVRVFHETFEEVPEVKVSVEATTTLEDFMKLLRENATIADLTFENPRLAGVCDNGWLPRMKEDMTVADYMVDYNDRFHQEGFHFALVEKDHHHEMLADNEDEVESMIESDSDLTEGSDKQDEDEKKTDRDGSESDDDGGHTPPPSSGAMPASGGYPLTGASAGFETLEDKTLEELEEMEASIKVQGTLLVKRLKEVKDKMKEVRTATKAERDAAKRKAQNKTKTENDARDRAQNITLNIRPSSEMMPFTAAVKKGDPVKMVKMRSMSHVHPDMEGEKKLMKKAKSFVFTHNNKTMEYDISTHRTTCRKYGLLDGDVITLASVGVGGAPVRKTIFKPKVMGTASFITDGDKSLFELAFNMGKSVAILKKMDFDTFLKDCGESELEEMKKFFESDRSKMELKLVKSAEFLKSYKDMNALVVKLVYSMDYLKDLMCDSILDKCDSKLSKCKDTVIRSIDIALALKRGKADMET
ncbi:unnamed protein product [Effrenium voratum]|uniref:Uncharacterized protein n=1 Tax=Effrenium voratum TaxID=2562239 RepID=A0AA36IE63_9DINO|nr:unnamed protein product [Effrenium voratum]CAJ1395759.1 unnamed protein product [Effrenium voratum]